VETTEHRFALRAWQTVIAFAKESDLQINDQWNQGLPCEEDGIAFCARCKPSDLPDTVYMTSGGSAFHATKLCRYLIEGQQKVADRGGTPAPIESVHRNVASRGYSPCLLCFPSHRGKA
jgi:hypothetical protein